MEGSNDVIYLPLLKDGTPRVSTFGDLWHWNKATNAGANILGEGFTSTHVQVYPIQKYKFKVRQIMNAEEKMNSLSVSAYVSVGLFMNALKVGGGASFEFNDETSYKEEQLFIQMDVATCTVRLMASAGKILDENVVQQIREGNIVATHYVSEIQFGAEALGDIRIRQNKTAENLHLGGNLDGNFVLGGIPVKVQLQLEFLDSDSETNYSADIQLQATPALGTPSTVAELFASLDKMAEAVGKPYSPEFFGPDSPVTGLPIRFKLAPLAELLINLDGVSKSLSPSVPPIPEALTTRYLGMMGVLHDFAQKDHIKRLIRSTDSRLSIIFDGIYGSENPLTVQVTQYETVVRALSLELKGRAVTAYSRYMLGEGDGLPDLEKVLGEYETKFDRGGVLTRVKGFTQEGRMLLARVHAVDSALAAKPNLFVSSDFELREWFGTVASNPRILLRTGGEENTGFLQLYKMVGRLEGNKVPVQVRVAFPNVAEGFGLDFKPGVSTQVISYEAKDIHFVLNFLSAYMPGGVEPVGELFYQLLGLTLGYSINPGEINNFPLTLDAVWEEANIRVAESFPGFLEGLGFLHQNAEWVFVILIQALDSAADALQNYLEARAQLKGSKLSHAWLVGTFNLSPSLSEGPIFLAFRRETLICACLDKLDVHLFLSTLLNNTGTAPDVEIFGRGRTQSLHPFKSEFAAAVFQTFSLGPPEPNPFTPLSSFEKEPPITLAEAMAVARAACSGNVRHLVDLTARLALQEWGNKLEPILKRYGWLGAEARFKAEMDTEVWKELGEKLGELRLEFADELSFHLDALKDLVEELGWGYIPDLLEKVLQYTIRCEIETAGYTGQEEAVRVALDEGKPHNALGLLAQCQCDPRLFKLRRDIASSRLTEFRNADLKTTVLTSMKATYGYSDENVKEIWLLPEFSAWMVASAEDEGVTGVIAQEFCQDGIPSFIPASLAAKIQILLTPVNEPEFEWLQQWGNVQDVIQSFQALLVRAAMPPNFGETLIKNLEQNAELKMDLKAAGVLFYWEEKDGYLSQPWGIDTIAEALARLEILRRSATKAVDESSTYMVPKTSLWKETRTHPKSFPSPTPVNYAWTMLTGGVLEPLSPVGLNHTIPRPLIKFSILPSAMGRILPYLAEQVWRRGLEEALHPSQTISYLNYQYGRSFEKGQIPLEGVELEKPHNFLLSRSDLVIALITASISDPLAIYSIGKGMAETGMALPLIIPDIRAEPGKDGVAVRSLLPLFGALVSPGQTRPLLAPPFNLIVLLRSGQAKVGRSTIINQTLMKDMNAFACRAEPGAEYGPPLMREGLVELLPLMEESVSEGLWLNVLQGYYSRDGSPALLANVHGDALRLPNVLQILKGLATSYIVFWGSGTEWAGLKAGEKQLRKMVGDGVKVYNLVVDANDTLESKIGRQNTIRTKELGAETKKLEAVFKEALLSPTIPTGGTQLQEAQSRALLQDVIPSIPTPESKALLHFVKLTGLRAAKALLLAEDARPAKKEFLELLANILNLSPPEMTKALSHVTSELEAMSAQTHTCELARVRALIALMEEGNGEELGMELRSALKDVSDRTLSLDDMLPYLNQWDDSEASYAKSFQLMNSGFPIEIWNERRGDILNNRRVGYCIEKFKNLRVFVLSIIGYQGAGKSSVLNKFFGPGFRVREGGCTKGIQARLLPLHSNLKEELGFDALLLLDTEGVRAPQNWGEMESSLRETRMLAFVLGVSHLTLVAVADTPTKQEKFNDLLQSSLLQFFRLGGLELNPDLLFIPPTRWTDPENSFDPELGTIVENLNSFVAKYAFHLGPRGKKRFELDKILFRRSNPSIPLDAFYETIIQVVREADKVLGMADWHTYSCEVWTQLQTHPPFIYEPIPAIQLHLEEKDLVLKAGLSLVAALRKHGGEIEDEYRQATIQGQSEDSLEKVLNKLKRYPFLCREAGDQQPCELCSPAIKNAEGIPSGKLEGWGKEARQMIWGRIRQMGWSLELRDGIGGGRMDLSLQDILAQFPDLGTRWWKYKQVVSTRTRVIPTTRLIAVEVEEEYGDLPTFMENMPLNPGVSREYLRERLAFEVDEHWAINPGDHNQESTLDWEQCYWLADEVVDIVDRVSNGSTTPSLYENGMVHGLRVSLDEMLVQYESLWHRKFISEFKHAVHFYGVSTMLKRFQRSEEIWAKVNLPLAQLEAREEDFPDLFQKGCYVPS